MIQYYTYLSRRKCKLNARKTIAKVIPTDARQDIKRKAAWCIVTMRNLNTLFAIGTCPPLHTIFVQDGQVKFKISNEGSYRAMLTAFPPENE